MLAAAGAGGVVAAIAAPGVRFDSNVVEMRNPDTESVQAFRELLRDSTTSPWYVDVIAADLEAADARARELAGLGVVERAVTLLDYVPSDQEAKLEILADTAYLLDVPAPRHRPEAPTPEEQVHALRDLAAALGVDWVDTSRAPIARSARLLRDRLRATLERLEGDPDPAATLDELEAALLGRLPQRLEALRVALGTPPVTLEDLPRDLRERMQAEDGRARIQVFPREDLSDDRALAAFVEAIRAVEPEATGLPVNVVEFGRATARSLRQALTWALAAIALVLALLWRRPVEAGLVLAPLLLAGLYTVGVMVAGDLAFNFANVIVLPLLLGIGVDSGIHLVARARRPVARGLVDTVTARAVLWSAVTTLVSFATLSLSGHRGIASLGLLLVIGMAATLVTMLSVLPALLATFGLPREDVEGPS